MKRLFISIIRAYQAILSPFLSSNTCRYEPSCSEYTIEAIYKYGAWKGTVKGIQRISRCHPWSTRDRIDHP